MIHVPRDLVLRCAGELSHLPGWRRRPLASTKRLICGLNSVFAAHDLFRYGHGFPRPSVTVRELERLQALCRTAARTGNCAAVRRRLDDLNERRSDTYGLLLFQAARVECPKNPLEAIQDGRAAKYLGELAGYWPVMIASFAESALIGLQPLVCAGRGGDRHRGALTDKDLVFWLGVVFRDATGRPRGITRSAYAEGDARYTGPFVRFAQIVSAALGRGMGGREVARLHCRLKAEEREQDLTVDERRKRALEHFRANGLDGLGGDSRAMIPVVIPPT